MSKLLAFFATIFISSAALAEQISLTPQNTLVMRGEVTEQSMAEASKQLLALHTQRGSEQYKIYIVLDTPGGEVDSGNSFIEFAQQIPNVETVTMFAASMGSAIVQGLPGKRHITASGTQMFHRARVGLSGQIEDGELESRLRWIKATIRQMETRNAARMRMSLDDYKRSVKDELWLLGEEAVTWRAADEISSISCSPELLQQRTKGFQTVFIFMTLQRKLW